MAKFAIKADPTFTAKVGFPVAGGATVDVLVTFRHRTAEELDKWLLDRRGMSDVDSFMSMVIGWELDEAFNAENVKILLQHRIGVAMATFMTYIDELTKSRSKN